MGKKYVTYDNFLIIWKKCFPFVKIREYKQVTGKCYVCLILTCLRSMFKDLKRKSIVNQLHAYHKSTYMCERQHYYNRCSLAELNQVNIVVYVFALFY